MTTKHVYLLVLMFFIACTNEKSAKSTEGYLSDTLDSTLNNDTVIDYSEFSGRYQIGDGGTSIMPYNDFYLMKNEKGEATDSLYAVGNEQSFFVYANGRKSIVFKMNADHRSGMYFEDDEKWPVSFIEPLGKEETELEESERIFKQRYLEDSIAYAELHIYNGMYQISTESEGVNAELVLEYNNDRTFDYTWTFTVASEEVNCEANRKGILIMDRTQHGSDRINDCMIHFNFNGSWNEGMVVEIEFEDQSKCDFIKGTACTFSGIYVNKNLH